MTITVVFDPPLPSDSPATFNTKAFTLLGDLNDWSTEANAVASAASTSAGTATTQAGNASTSAGTATTQAGIATTQAGIATTQAGNASTSAGTATTKASDANNSAIAAAASAALIAGLTPTDNAVIIGNGTNFVVESGATLKTSLGLTIGTDVQAYDADLTTWAGVTPGTGVATALAVNVGSAGSPVVNGGVLGTPSSGTLTNATGLPPAGVTGTALVAAAIGSTVQAYNSNLTAINQALTASSSPSFAGVTINSADQATTNAQLTYGLDYAIDQSAMANKRVTDVNVYQNQTGTASFTQTASTDLIRTYATTTVSLPRAYLNTDYQVIVEPVSASPALGFQGEITVQSRAVNSFVLQMSGSATACSVRWKVKHNNPEGRVYAVGPTAQ